MPSKDPFLIVWGESHDPAPVGKKLPILTTAYGHVEIPLIFTLFILFMGILKIILPYANVCRPKVPDCCLLMSLGFAIGGLVYCTRDFGSHNDKYMNIVESFFNPSTFFLILLPPIVLEAGYYMPKGPFMHNIGTILTYAIIGTIFNSFCTGGCLYGVYKAGWMPGLDEAHEMPINPLHMLLFGSIISAVDPVAVIAVFEEIQVNMLLYICVFGESLLNDGVAVVLFKVFEAFLGMDEADIDAKNILRAVLKFFVVAGGGTLFGIVCGYIGAFSTKYTQNKTIVEPLFIFGVSYACYLAAEACGLSAILAVVFCGFTMVSYVEHNISAKSHTVVKQSMKLIAHISEMIIFLLLGTSAITDFWVHWNTAFVMWTLLFISVFRLISVYGLTAILNKNRVEKISFVDQFIMAYGGLRGGIAFGLMKLTSLQLVPHSNAMLCVTLVVVFFTSFIQGATAGPFVQLLQVRKKDDHEKGMNEEVYYRAMGHLNSGINDVVGRYGMSSILRRFERFNAKYINPVFTHDPHLKKDQEILEINKRMNIKEATKIVGGSNRKSVMPTAAKMNIAQMLLPNVAMILPGLGDDIAKSRADSDKKQEEAEENLILHAQLKTGLLPTRENLEAKAIIGEANDTANQNLMKKHKKAVAATRRRSETHRHRHQQYRGNSVVTSGDLHYLHYDEAVSQRAFFSMPRERHISEARHVSVMETIPDKSGSDDCISVTSEKSWKEHPWRYTQRHEAQVDPRGHE